jgi:hypothetical protein
MSGVADYNPDNKKQGEEWTVVFISRGQIAFFIPIMLGLETKEL